MQSPQLSPVRWARCGITIGIVIIRAVCLAADDRYSVDAWQQEDGLPSDSVTALAQTADGFLWVGTENGLARFDGVRFTVLREPKELVAASVAQMFTEKSGALWVSLNNGALFRKLDGAFVPFTSTSGWSNAAVASFAQDESGYVVLLTAKGGVWRFSDERFQRVLPDSRQVMELAADEWGDRSVWVRRGLSVGMLRGTNWTEVACDAEPPVRLGPLTPRRSGGVWLFAAQRRLDVLNGGRWPTESRAYPNFMDPERLLEDSAGNIWVGTTRQGLVRLARDGSHVRHYTGTSLPTDDVNCLFEDRDGNVWVGGNSGGLMRISRRNFYTPRSLSGFPLTAPLFVTPDSSPAMWVGFAQVGLCRFGSNQMAPPPSGLRGTGWAALPARDGRLWYSVYGYALVLSHRGKIRTWTVEDGLPSNDIQALAEDAAGTLWIGSVRGLTRFDGTNFVHLDEFKAVRRREVHALAIDGSGNVWAGTTGSGLVRWQPGRLEVFATTNGLPSNLVRSLFVDADDVLWIGTSSGLCMLRSGTLFAFDERSGLPGNEIAGIAQDDAGMLWLATSRGVLSVPRAELLARAAGKAGRLNVRSFDLTDGLPALRMSAGQPCVARAHDGRMWFATLKGLAIIEPREVRPPVAPPVPRIEEMRVDGLPVTTPKISPGSRRVELHYTAANLTSPERVRFQLRLEGLNDDWQPATTERFVAYHGLRAGNYRLDVMTVNDEGTENAERASQSFTVLPWFWETGWFRSGAVLAAVLVLAGVVHLRTRTLERHRAAQEAFSRRLIAHEEAERKRIAAELHDSLEQNLLVIKNRALLALDGRATSSVVQESLHEISDVSSGSIEEVRAIASNLRPHQLDRLGLTRALTAMLRTVVESSGLRITSELGEVNGRLNKEAEINLYRIVQEGLNNILKHAHATEASVTLKDESGRLRLRIADNGRGFDAATRSGTGDGSGFGLAGMSERARMAGGKLQVHSSPGRGTELIVELPMPEGTQAGKKV